MNQDQSSYNAPYRQDPYQPVQVDSRFQQPFNDNVQHGEEFNNGYNSIGLDEREKR
jgi:hypothetical protein